jgi:uncharacterized protein
MNCPICARETNAKYRPFCSRRCADLDLGNWLSGRYTMPSQDLEDTGDPDRSPPAPDPRLH